MITMLMSMLRRIAKTRELVEGLREHPMLKNVAETVLNNLKIHI